METQKARGDKRAEAVAPGSLTDGRAKIIRLTERGWEVRRVVDEIIASLEEECIRSLGEDRMRQFEELMKEVSGVLEEHR